MPIFYFSYRDFHEFRTKTINDNDNFSIDEKYHCDGQEPEKASIFQDPSTPVVIGIQNFRVPIFYFSYRDFHEFRTKTINDNDNFSIDEKYHCGGQEPEKDPFPRVFF